MKHLIKLMEYKFCNKCKSEIKDNKKFCKNCQPKVNKTKKYYSYKFKNSQLVRIGQELTSTSSSSSSTSKSSSLLQLKIPQKLKLIYYTNPLDINLLSQVQYSKFTSIDHLAQYLLNSNRFPISQLFGEFGLNFRNLRQIRGLIDKSKLEFQNDCNKLISGGGGGGYGGGIDISSNFIGIEELFKQEFWDELIKLYLLHFHLNLPVFNLPENQIIYNLPQPLLISIYCWGYICKKRKTPEITEYMDKLAQNNVNRIIFKPSLSNCQALYIQYYNYYRRGKIREGRACISHLIRMCYSLGLQVDSQLFKHEENYNRSNLFLNILCSQKNINTAYMIFPVFEFELSQWNNNLFNPEWYKLPRGIKYLLNLSDREDELFSRLSSLKNKSKVEYLTQIKFPTNFSEYSNEQIEALCNQKFENLRNNYIMILKEYEVLKLRFKSRTIDLMNNFEMVTLHYLQSILLIYEYGRLKSAPTPTPSTLIQKIIQICDQILNITLNPNNQLFKNYLDLNYLVGFTYLQIFDNLENIKKREVLEKFKKLIDFRELGDYQLLQYLIFYCGFKYVNK